MFYDTECVGVAGDPTFLEKSSKKLLGGCGWMGLSNPEHRIGLVAADVRLEVFRFWRQALTFR